MTQIEAARKGETTPEIKEISKAEKISEDKIRKRVAKGTIVITKNLNRENVKPIGIGSGLKVKVNANIGTSPDYSSIEEEIEKGKIAVKYGADTLMDLSTGGDLDRIRRKILNIPVPIGTVPIYQAAVEAVRDNGSIVDMTEDDIFDVIEKHAKDGVDFMTLHVGLTQESLQTLLRQKRLTGIVSRGGSFLAAWMIHNKKENPLYQDFDYLLEIAREYDVTLSLGDALRPGSIYDSTDKPQIHELRILGELVERAWEKGVQCMVEGPGHIPLNEIEANVILEKKICKGAPFYVLGPLVTDIALGYDHITAAIGGAIAAYAGADFLCYVTPSEHLALPTVEDVKLGVIASKIAAHAADIARGIDIEKDYEMSKARANLNWRRQFELCVDPEKAKAFRKERQPQRGDVCTMCGEFCAMRIVREYLRCG
jgi:phosphomethylpyrimidine synthase